MAQWQSSSFVMSRLMVRFRSPAPKKPYIRCAVFLFFDKISRILRKQRNDRASQKAYRAPFTRLLRECAVPLSRGTERLCRSADVARRLLFGDVFCSRRSAVCSAKTPSVVFKQTKKIAVRESGSRSRQTASFLRYQPFSL